MNLADKITSTPRFSDVRLINSIFAPSEIKREFISMITYRSRNSFRFWMLVFKSTFNFFVECGTLPLRMLGRVRWGKGSVGFIILAFSIFFMTFLSIEMSVDSWWNFGSGIWQILKGIVTDFEIPWQNIYANWQLGSTPMAIHLSLLSVLGFVQVTAIKTNKKWRDEKNPEQKGTSLLYFVLKNHVKLNARYYNCFVNPAIWILFTILTYHIIPFGIYQVFLTWASACLVYQELRDYLAQKKVEENI